MPNLLIGTSYAVSAGLVVCAIQSGYAPADARFVLVMVWAVAGLLLAAMAIMLARKES